MEVTYRACPPWEGYVTIAMKGFFHDILKNTADCFRGRFLGWHLVAIILTAILALSGFDWAYFVYLNGSLVQKIFFPAVILGSLLPLVVPLLMFAVNRSRKKLKNLNTAYAIGQAALLGLILSSAFKAVTGRAHPPDLFMGTAGADMSRIFQFGFWRAGVFWGWPSTHTTIAFAMAVALFILYPKNKAVRFGAVLYAFYIGIGVSMSIHWFSDFAAGVIIGTIIGIVVGKSFWNRYASIGNILNL